MSVNWTIMRQAVVEAGTTLSLADSIANDIARLLIGRLRRVDGRTLKQLKAELRDFDSAGWSGRGWKK